MTEAASSRSRPRPSPARRLARRGEASAPRAHLRQADGRHDNEIVVDDPDAPEDRRRRSSARRSVDIVVYAAAARARGAARLRQLAHRHGLGAGRPAGRLLPVLSLAHPRRRQHSTASSARSSTRRAADEPFVTRDQLRRVLQVFVPTLLFCLADAVARPLRRELPAGRRLHALHRRASRWWKSLLTGVRVRRSSMFVDLRRRLRRHHAEGAARSGCSDTEGRRDGSTSASCCTASRSC